FCTVLVQLRIALLMKRRPLGFEVADGHIDEVVELVFGSSVGGVFTNFPERGSGFWCRFPHQQHGALPPNRPGIIENSYTEISYVRVKNRFVKCN
ncbi:MAG: hypothetical protein U5K79_26105, partial [Cyclobacteriaceae bacterium]|nr:hypothetical protein [Cyclobacteriaceae bacterium]